jgi:peptidyl-prolyl cis-trans isomerase C
VIAEGMQALAFQAHSADESPCPHRSTADHRSAVALFFFFAFRKAVFMFKQTISVLAATMLLAGAAAAQNVAVVNGKAVPKARVDAILERVKKQSTEQGRPLPPDIDQRIRESVVVNEIFTQEAERRGLQSSAEFRSQMDVARQQILVQLLRDDVRKKTVISDADMKAEYEKAKSANSGGTEYQARHILVEKEDEAKSLITQIKGGAKFEDLAKKLSKDPGSGQNGGDLGFAKPDAYVPEFGKAMSELKKGEMTPAPVKTQFGWHIIKLEDSRAVQFPPFDDVKPQLQQQMAQGKEQDALKALRDSAKTDFKFTQ